MLPLCQDNARLDREHVLKCLYYDVADIRQHVAQLTKVDEEHVSLSACVFSWRGAMSRISHEGLVTMGLSTAQCELLSVCHLKKSYQAIIAGSRSTLRQRGVVGSPTARAKGVAHAVVTRPRLVGAGVSCLHCIQQCGCGMRMGLVHFRRRSVRVCHAFTA